ncbi:MAG TPA: hypothetical protein VMS93_01505 [Candidatus Saccharimonadales bacterium]|nr:hypothetical protein [Candidatus Saccharimonadales bacterium]
MADKPKLAIYWSSSCGGCEIAFANLHGHILDVAGHFGLAFRPCLLDTSEEPNFRMIQRRRLRLLDSYGIEPGRCRLDFVPRPRGRISRL